MSLPTLRLAAGSLALAAAFALFTTTTHATTIALETVDLTGQEVAIEDTITVAGTVSDYIVSGGAYSGVARLVTNTGSLCTGTLLADGKHILTAAHCVTDSSGAISVDTVTSTFIGTTTSQSIASASIDVHPDWDGNSQSGVDLAIITLEQEAASDYTGYEIFSDSLSVGVDVVKAGYGLTGTGDTGTVSGTAGTLHAGLNEYEALYSAAQDWLLVYDFDSADCSNNTLALLGIASSCGLGDDEVMAAPGDSGSASFVLGTSGQFEIVGVTSFGFSIDGATDSDYGDFGADVYAYNFYDWITSFLSSTTDTVVATAVSVSAPSGLLVLALPMCWLLLRRRQLATD